MKHLPTPQGHTPSTFMELFRNCNGPTSRGLPLVSLHNALEISSTRGAPKSVPIPVPVPPTVPNGCNLKQRLMGFSSQAGKSFPGSTVQLPKCNCPTAGHGGGSVLSVLSSGSSATLSRGRGYPQVVSGDTVWSLWVGGERLAAGITALDAKHRE